ncbi:FAD-dependent oxidoreductase [Methylomonas rhizoryzae]|nr:bifunctional TVP38/TMEM64 family protein/FAD-dependent oxidoreductase [Methylomonas rhizoryzae]
MTASKIKLALLLGVLIAMFLLSDLPHYLTLENLKAQQNEIEAYRLNHPFAAMMGYLGLYIAVTGLSLPGAAVLTIAGGGIFGLFWSTVLVSFASSIGATLAFLAARFLFRDWVRAKFGSRLKAIEAGLQRDGPYYLFSLRLVPIFPFFLINLAMGLTPMKTATFYWVSQAGMLAGTLVYVNAGTQLAQIESAADIMSSGLIVSFALLGLFPLLAKRALDYLQQRKIVARWPKPARFDHNLVVIGGGAGGLVTAYLAAALKAKVTLVEKERMGGDCLNTGCVPSKALLKSAQLVALIRRAGEFGLKNASAEVDFPAVMRQVRQAVAQVAPHDSVERYRSLGVNVIQGTANIVSPWQVEVSSASGVETLSTRAIVIAAGAHPVVPVIPGLEHIDYLTSDTIWNLQQLPDRLLILGGGPIGCELAQAFARLGSRVTQVEMLPRLLIKEDPEVSECIAASLVADGVDLRLGHTAKRFDHSTGQARIIAECAGREVEIAFDRVVLAIGRAATVEGYGAENLGLALSARRTIATDAYQRTNYPTIFAVGDVAGPYQFTHTAAHQAWYAAINALFGQIKAFRTDYSAVPWATFTDPEVARVGLNEQDAQSEGVAYEVSHYSLADLDRAITDRATAGFVKVLTVPGSDKILGAAIVGRHAAESIGEFVLAMSNGLGLNKILGSIHIYPTLAEANQHVAGVWKRNHAPRTLLTILQRYHAWMRG